MSRLAELMKNRNYGLRYGTNDHKQDGYFGALQIPNSGNVATEYSIGQEINGRNVEMPSLVPTLNEYEINQTLQSAANHQLPPLGVREKALRHAQDRIANGRSPFWAIPENQYSRQHTPNNYQPLSGAERLFEMSRGTK